MGGAGPCTLGRKLLGVRYTQRETRVSGSRVGAPRNLRSGSPGTRAQRSGSPGTRAQESRGLGWGPWGPREGRKEGELGDATGDGVGAGTELPGGLAGREQFPGFCPGSTSRPPEGQDQHGRTLDRARPLESSERGMPVPKSWRAGDPHVPGSSS